MPPRIRRSDSRTTRGTARPSSIVPPTVSPAARPTPVRRPTTTEWPMSSSRTDCLRDGAIALLLLAACKAPPAVSSAPVTVVNGQQVRAAVPAQARTDPAAYESFVKQLVYRTAVLQGAAAGQVALTAAERAAVEATLPSRAATREYLRQQGITYEEYAKEAYEVALVQKMERRDVF